MNRLLTISAMALLSAVLIIPANAQERKKITIGLGAKSQSNAVFQAAYAGARNAAKELGEKYNADVVIDWQTPADEDAQKQAQAIDALARSGAQGIAVSCSEANTLRPAIDRAVSAGVAVMCFDSDSPRSKRLCYYGTDDETCGKTVMAELAKATGGKGTVAILAGNQSAPNLQNRLKGARQELKNHPEMKELNDGNGVFYHAETPEDSARALQSAQATNPNITAWCLIGGWPLFTKGAIKTPPGQVKIVSVDALPAQLPYVKEGYVEALYAQDCYGWGYKSVQILLDKIVHNKEPESKRIIDPLTRVTKENADEYGRNWDKWLGK